MGTLTIAWLTGQCHAGAMQGTHGIRSSRYLFEWLFKEGSGGGRERDREGEGEREREREKEERERGRGQRGGKGVRDRGAGEGDVLKGGSFLMFTLRQSVLKNEQLPANADFFCSYAI